ncbi:MAG: cell division ATP-binding protein FtsE [Myxococcales bacterium]|nr:cell division ATP-binding protein FtsE [Myxococcales bacterium]
MIKLFHVTKRYGRDNRALDDVSLRLHKGEFAFVTGHSGAGKSTLMRLLFAAEKPTEGEVLVAGHNVGRLDRTSIPILRRNIGVVFQDFKLLQQRTVFENVAFTLEVLGRPRHEIRDRVRTILRQVGLAHKSKSLPLRMSGGEQQRVAIARALVNEPMVLLADEPTGNLDTQLSLEIMALLEAANARGTTILVATHDLSLPETLGKRVITLEHGRIKSDK